MKTLAVATLLALPAIAGAQDQAGAARRIRIETNLETAIARQTLVDGETVPRNGRGMLPDGKSSIELRQTVAFEERGDGTRHYLQAQSDETTKSEDAEPRALHVDGALESRTVVPAVDDQGAAVLLEVVGDTRRELAAELAEGVPGQLDFGVLVPAADLEDGASVELNGDVRAAVRRLLHPVVAEPRRGRGRGGRGFMRGGVERSMLTTWIAALQAPELKLESSAKYVAATGDHPAQVNLHLVLQGEGTTEKLGLAAPSMFSGRGPRGGSEQANEAEAKIVMDVVAQLDAERQHVVRVEASGTLEAKSRVARSGGRGGDPVTTETKETITSKLGVKFVDGGVK